MELSIKNLEQKISGKVWYMLELFINVFYHTVAEIRNNVRSFMESVMKEPQTIIDRLYVRMESDRLAEILQFNFV